MPSEKRIGKILHQDACLILCVNERYMDDRPIYKISLFLRSISGSVGSCPFESIINRAFSEALDLKIDSKYCRSVAVGF